MKATVAVLTYNGEEYLEQLLTACLGQAVDFDFEVVVVDSGSTDSTLEIVARHPAVRLHQIPNAEFGHGRTRNLAASLARGEIVVYLTQDAVPASDAWLVEMLRPFEIGDQIACVFGKQIPRADCVPSVKRDVEGVFSSFGPDQFVSLQRANPAIRDEASRDSIAFLSNVNSAIRRSVLTTIPFRDVAYAEDQAFGRDVTDAGLCKCYAPLAAVIHSHSYPLAGYFRRMYEEMHGLRLATGRSLDTRLVTHLRVISRDSARDWRFILRDPAYSRRQKLNWLLKAPLYNVARRVAIRVSERDRAPDWVTRLLR